MSLQAKTAEKLAECLGSHASFKAEHKQCGHDQADEPGAACLCLPQRRLRVAVSAIDRLPVSMHATFGKPSVIRQAPDALLPVLTNRIENNNALGPQSHGVGPSSGGWLTSRKSALQSTRSTATCPALRGWPSRATNGHWGSQHRRHRRGPQSDTDYRHTDRARDTNQCSCGTGECSHS